MLVDAVGPPAGTGDIFLFTAVLTRPQAAPISITNNCNCIDL